MFDIYIYGDYGRRIAGSMKALGCCLPYQQTERSVDIFYAQGLGKTITGLGLMLRTRRTMAAAPPGCKSHTMRSTKGNAIGYYLLPSPATAGRKRPQPGMGLPDQTPRSSGRRSRGPRGAANGTPHSDIATPTPPAAALSHGAGVEPKIATPTPSAAAPPRVAEARCHIAAPPAVIEAREAGAQSGVAASSHSAITIPPKSPYSPSKVNVQRTSIGSESGAMKLVIARIPHRIPAAHTSEARSGSCVLNFCEMYLDRDLSSTRGTFYCASFGRKSRG